MANCEKHLKTDDRHSGDAFIPKLTKTDPTCEHEALYNDSTIATTLFIIFTCCVMGFACCLCYLHKLSQDAMRRRVAEDIRLEMNTFTPFVDKNDMSGSIYGLTTTEDREVTSLEPQRDASEWLMSIYPFTMGFCMVISWVFIAATCTRSHYKRRENTNTYINGFNQSTMVVFHVINSAFLIHLVVKNILDRIDAFGTEATCYCSPMASRVLNISNSMYHCLCMVPSEETPWQLFVNNPAEIDDVALRDLGSEYEGDVRAIYQDTLMDEMSASKMHMVELNKLINIIQVSIPFLSIHIIMWSIVMYITSRDTRDLHQPITSNALEAASQNDNGNSANNGKDSVWIHTKTVLLENAYMFGEAIDFFSLIDDLVEHGRDFTMDRLLANVILSVFGYGLFVIYVIYPLTKIYESHFKCLQSDYFIKSLTLSVNLFLLVVRSILFVKYGGIDSVKAPTFFLLFIVKESYTLIQKSSEVIIECACTT